MRAAVAQARNDMLARIHLLHRLQVVVRVVDDAGEDEPFAVIVDQHVVGDVLRRAALARGDRGDRILARRRIVQRIGESEHPLVPDAGEQRPGVEFGRVFGGDARPDLRIPHRRDALRQRAGGRSSDRCGCRRTGSGCRSARAMHRSGAAARRSGRADRRPPPGSTDSSRSFHAVVRSCRWFNENTSGRPQDCMMRRTMANSVAGSGVFQSEVISMNPFPASFSPMAMPVSSVSCARRSGCDRRPRSCGRWCGRWKSRTRRRAPHRR